MGKAPFRPFEALNPRQGGAVMTAQYIYFLVVWVGVSSSISNRYYFTLCEITYLCIKLSELGVWRGNLMKKGWEINLRHL